MSHRVLAGLNLVAGSSALLLVASVSWLALTLSGDIAESSASPVLRVDGFGLYAFSIVATFLGTALPLLLVLSLFRSVNGFQPARYTRQDTHSVVPVPFSRYLLLLLLSVGILALFYFVELVIPFSVVPFATAVSGTLFAAIFCFRPRGLTLRFRITALSVGLLLILSMTFLDWNPRKPFLRDLYRIRLGMTVAEVERAMDGYLNTPTSEDPRREIKPDDRIIYRPSNEPAYNADWGIITFRDGKVESVEYSAD